MESLFVQTRDLRMHYLQEGTGDPVIFIHGFPETSYEWRHQFAALSSTYACFAPDTRGFGQTEKPGVRVSRRLLAADIVHFMDALGIEKAAVVAHDWGGIIAFKLAIDFPERLTRLALLDTLCTVWSPGGVHGYWFKAEPYPEEFFAQYHRQFIDAVITGSSEPALPGRPFSPWAARPASSAVQRWATDEDVEHYRRAFADPLSHASAISYYRYGLPFHIVHEDATASHGERFESLGERKVAEMWTHPEGLEQHPLYVNYMDYGPEDRHKRFEKPTLWMHSNYLARSRGTEPVAEGAPRPAGNPFSKQFPRYFPDLRSRRVDAGHFFPEEAPVETNEALAAFLSGNI